MRQHIVSAFGSIEKFFERFWHRRPQGGSCVNIILLSSRLKTAKTLHITPRFLVSASLAMLLLLLTLSFALSWMFIQINLPIVAELAAEEQQKLAAEEQQRLAAEGQQEQQKFQLRTEEYVRDNVSSMATRLGEIQAQVLRLDSLSERIAKLSGLSLPSSELQSKPGKEGKDSTDGKGGPLISLVQPLSASDLAQEIDRFSELIERRRDELTVFESQLMERRIKSALLPTLKPIEARTGSVFGLRTDPFTGVGAVHEGLDFPVETGTQIVAAAGGVVAVAEYHSQYGNMVEIDHGNDFSSRYAHMSQLDVKPGQVIKRGQRIGASGNSGRSTGPHLHFEVRYKDVAQDPARFLQQSSQTALAKTVTETKPLLSAKKSPEHKPGR